MEARELNDRRWEHALVVLSGGQDSTTCLYLAKHRMAKKVSALTIDYGQRHAVELEAARIIAMSAKVDHEVIKLGSVLKGTSPLVNLEKGVESYANAAALPGGIEKTFVPMRNALFLVLAVNRAVVLGCDVVVTGVSEEDYGGYPDCRELFIDKMQDMVDAALAESVDHAVGIETPLMYLDKEATVKLALELDGCMAALAYSHTCYEGKTPPCGRCHACLLRAKGFDLAGVIDPLVGRFHLQEASRR